LRSRMDGNSPKEFRGVEKPVRNFGDQDFGSVDLIKATASSVNTAYFQLGMEVGPRKVADMAHAAGIPRDVPLQSPQGDVQAGISLGLYDVHVIDQAVGFATFANKGVAVEPIFVKTVHDGRDKIYQAAIVERRAFDEGVAADATYAMQQVVENGTAQRAQLEGGRPAAGKTGTTTDNFDAWFVGYTPQLSTAVWIGTGRNETIDLEDGGEATGGRVSTGIWKAFMDVALADQPVEQFPDRANVGRVRNGKGVEDFRSARPRTTDEPTASASAPPPLPTAPPAPVPPPPRPSEPPPPRPSEPPPSSDPPQPSDPPPSSSAPDPPGGGRSGP
ncbi:MAG TPA: penicillin-binding transpeptidase domain-containing protein, partial [Mycobacteriales bacterium]|nr:penicillin-binding transpeptidase domain-containing protein [Mycobacteriales bacterium]